MGKQLLDTENFKYDKNTTHKSFKFGPTGSGAKTAMCKAYLSPSDCFEIIDLDICKRNWKDVECPICLEIKSRVY